MNPMVLKYVGLTGIAYGIHVYLAFAQLALCLLLIGNGMILLFNTKELPRWIARFGFSLYMQGGERPGNSLLMILTGIAFILPLFGLPYWLAVFACPVAIYFILALQNGTAQTSNKIVGGVARKGLMVSAVVVFGFTIWEGRDLVHAGLSVTYKAAYWDYKEVQGWQKDNNPNAPKVGDLAPDFNLTNVDGVSTVRLSDFRGDKPVVLLFGSFT